MKLPLILNGLVVRDHIAIALKQEVESMPVQPIVTIVQVGDRAESGVYIRQKKLFAQKIGVRVDHVQFPNDITEEQLVNEIKKLNKNKSVNGILVQLPLPSHIEKENIIETVDPEKDIDGLHSLNVKKLWSNDPSGNVPATARAVASLLQFYNIDLSGKRILVIGRSTLVGKPLAHVFINSNATVTIAHSKTKHLTTHTQQADIIVAAAGIKKLIGLKHVKKGQIVIDVGIHVVELKEERKIIGDVDFSRVSKVVKAISPVPGGVGPLTVASIFQNTIESMKRNARQTRKKVIK